MSTIHFLNIKSEGGQVVIPKELPDLIRTIKGIIRSDPPNWVKVLFTL